MHPPVYPSGTDLLALQMLFYQFGYGWVTVGENQDGFTKPNHSKQRLFFSFLQHSVHHSTMFNTCRVGGWKNSMQREAEKGFWPESKHWMLILGHVSRRKPCLCASTSVQATRGIGQYFSVELKRYKMGWNEPTFCQLWQFCHKQ